MGVRLNNSWQPPKPTAIRYTQDTPKDKEATKLEKLKTVLAGPNTNLGNFLIKIDLIDARYRKVPKILDA